MAYMQYIEYYVQYSTVKELMHVVHVHCICMHACMHMCRD